MVQILKVCVASQTGIPDIRRLAVNSDVLSSYSSLAEKVSSLFPKLSGKSFEIFWKDVEGDDIVVTSDDELAHAVANNEDDVVKIYVRFTGADTDPKPAITGDCHQGVRCDGCNGSVVGHRYKCLQCKDYDLCSTCNALGKHPYHDMLKLVTPAYFSRQWLFVGWKRMFCSMFGREPNTEMIDNGNEPLSKCPYLTGERCGKPAKWPNMTEEGQRPSTLYPLNQDLPFAKLYQENGAEMLKNIGQFITGLLDPLGVDVKVDIDHPTNESKPQQPELSKEEPKKTREAANETATEAKVIEEASAETSAPKEETKVEESCPLASVIPSDPVACTGARPKAKSPEAEKVTSSEKTVPVMSHGLFAQNAPTGYEMELIEPTDSAHQDANGPNDEWTFINSTNGAAIKTEKREEPTASPAKDSEEVRYPVLVEVTNTPEKIQESRAKEEPIPASGDEFPDLSQLDPQVANALSKMRAMGFTNEGGWLLRLLQAKRGNINEALDSLYPNRH